MVKHQAISPVTAAARYLPAHAPNRPTTTPTRPTRTAGAGKAIAATAQVPTEVTNPAGISISRGRSRVTAFLFR
ncbi:hypothetical protein [Nonomuraea insulae]|uniref:Uncharacterized protein n=1 Tax=Nonomuraea insulae TaxID=1616787 RepID=A0ABW1CPA1_9ACTN